MGAFYRRGYEKQDGKKSPGRWTLRIRGYQPYIGYDKELASAGPKL